MSTEILEQSADFTDSSLHLLGRSFGDFTVRSSIGSGGSGDVYLADQLALGREAVIKVTAPQSGHTQGATKRFLREARLASQLDHPFAAHSYGFGTETDGTMWIAISPRTNHGEVRSRRWMAEVLSLYLFR